MSIFRILVANTVQEWKCFNGMDRISPNLCMYVFYLGLALDSSVANFPLVRGEIWFFHDSEDEYYFSKRIHVSSVCFNKVLKFFVLILTIKNYNTIYMLFSLYLNICDCQKYWRRARHSVF